MLQPQSRPLKREKTGNAWGELEAICRTVHAALYERRDVTSARRYRLRLGEILARLPENDQAILREEGLALVHELRGEVALAIPHRQREIRLMMKLHRSVKESVTKGDYDAKTGQSILVGRGLDALKERRAILKAMQLAKSQDAIRRAPPSRRSTQKATIRNGGARTGRARRSQGRIPRP
jgi:hypothetical protein